MSTFENKQLLSTEVSLSDELNDEELSLVSGGGRRRDPDFEKGRNEGDEAQRKIKNGFQRGLGFVVGLID